MTAMLQSTEGISQMDSHSHFNGPLSNASFSSSDHEGPTYTDWPGWIDKLRSLFRDEDAVGAHLNRDQVRVMTWYIDHHIDQWCSHPKLVQLGPEPEFWFDELKFPWLPLIPFREQVFIDVVVPDVPKYPFENHVADVLLTTRPALLSVLVSVQIDLGNDAHDPREEVEQIYKIAGPLERTQSLHSLQARISKIQQLRNEGFDLTLADAEAPDQAIQLFNGRCLKISAHMVQDSAHGCDEDLAVLLDITNLENVRQSKPKKLPRSEEIDGAPLSLAVSSSLSNVNFEAMPGYPLFSIFEDEKADRSDGAPLSMQAVSSSPTHAVFNSVGAGPPEEDPNMQDVFLFRRHGQPMRVGTVVDAYELSVPLPDVPEDIAVAIVHFLHDVPAGHVAKHVLIDLEIHGHKIEPRFRSGPLVRRSVEVIPARLSRHALLAHMNVDQYCQLEGGRCLVFHNLVRWADWDEAMRDVKHGDYFKISLPPSESFECSTDQLLGFVQRGYSNDEILDQVSVYGAHEGYSPSPLSPGEVRELRTENIESPDDAFMALQHTVLRADSSRVEVAFNRRSLSDSHTPEQSHFPGIVKSACLAVDVPSISPKCSLTDEFLEAVDAARQAADNEILEANDVDAAPSIFVQELDELWSTAVEQGNIDGTQRVRVESWFTNHLRHTRCHNSRITLLSSDATAWERQLLDTWNDRALPGVETEFAIVYPPTEDMAINALAQIVIVQRPQYDHRSLIITVYDSDPELEHPHTFALVLYERDGLEYVLEDLRLVQDCPPARPQNECTLWFGSYPIREGQLVHLRHGNALKLYIRRGIPVDLSALHLMSDSRLRQVLQDAIWGQIFVRPPSLVPAGESSQLRASSFVAHSIADLASSSQTISNEQDPRPQWIQDLHAIFDRESFVEREEEGPVVYVLVWNLHGSRHERCNEPRTVRLGRTPFEWRTDLVFAWRNHLERAVPVEFYVVRPAPPSQPWQSIAAHIILVQSLQSEQTAVVLLARA
eukprot:s4243_g4.t1